MIERICQCGKQFLARPDLIRKGKANFCSLKCFGQSRRGSHLSIELRAKISQATKASMQSDSNLRQKLSEVWKNNWSDPKLRAQMLRNLSIAHKKMWQNPEFKARMAEIRKRLWQEPEFRKMMLEAQSGAAIKRWQKPEYRKHQIEAQVKSWQDPEIVAKRFAGLIKKPNKPEQRLIDIFSRCLPQFQYNGDFSLGVTLTGLIPDFVNVNGKKEVIEILGDYFHSPEVIGDRWQGSELGKVMLYNSLGYQCLIIWEHELNELSEDELVGKVNKFFSKRRR